MLRTILHDVARRHSAASRDGLGTFTFCMPRLRDRGCRIWFRPDLDGAGWSPVPAVRDEAGILLFERMLNAGSALEAMALLRRESS